MVGGVQREQRKKKERKKAFRNNPTIKILYYDKMKQRGVYAEEITIFEVGG